MKKELTWGAIAVLIGAALVFWLGGFLTKEAPETQWKGEPLELAAAPDPALGLYEVQYFLIQRGPWPNPALLPATATIYWKETPTLETLKEVIPLAEYLRKYRYVLCDDCPVFVKTIRQPVKPKEPKEDTEQMPEEK